MWIYIQMTWKPDRLTVWVEILFVVLQLYYALSTFNIYIEEHCLVHAEPLVMKFHSLKTYLCAFVLINCKRGIRREMEKSPVSWLTKEIETFFFCLIFVNCETGYNIFSSNFVRKTKATQVNVICIVIHFWIPSLSLLHSFKKI